jgi:hypothetical protein
MILEKTLFKIVPERDQNYTKDEAEWLFEQLPGNDKE